VISLRLSLDFLWISVTTLCVVAKRVSETVLVSVFYFIAGVFSLTFVLRDCNSSIPVEVSGQVPLQITDRCVHGKFQIDFQGNNFPINATVCPCTTSFCNSGAITLGGTAGTGSPPSSSSRNPSTPTQTVSTTSESTRMPQGR